MTAIIPRGPQTAPLVCKPEAPTVRNEIDDREIDIGKTNNSEIDKLDLFRLPLLKV